MKSTKVKEIKMRNAELPDKTTEQVQAERVSAGSSRNQRFSKITDSAAQSDLWVRNEPIPGAKALWPYDYKYQYCDLYYPNAVGGGIYIDLPGAPYEVTLCKAKHDKLNPMGIRYTWLASNESQADLLARLPPDLPKGDEQRKEGMI